MIGAVLIAATLSGGVALTPNPARVGQNVVLSGCGYAVDLSGNATSVTINGPLGTAFFYEAVDPDGCLAPIDVRPTTVGQYAVKVWQRVRKKRYRPTDIGELMGSAVLTVTP